MDRAKVRARIKEAAPQTAAEWLEFVLTERGLAVQDDRDDATRRLQLLEGMAAKQKSGGYARQPIRRS